MPSNLMLKMVKIPLALTLLATCLLPSTAFAMNVVIASPEEQALMDRKSELTSNISDIDGEIAATEADIARIEDTASPERRRYDQSIVSLYKMQKSPGILLDMLTGTSALEEAVTEFEAYVDFADTCMSTIKETQSSIQSAQDNKDALSLSRSDLVAELELVDAELGRVSGERQAKLEEVNHLLASADNSDLARFSAAMAYSKKVSFADGYPATESYKAAWQEALPGDSIPCGRSCDRGVMIPVTLFGTDTTFPTVCRSQFSYLQASDKWVDLGVWDRSFSSLEPGDVLISIAGIDGGSYDHSCMYVGYDITQEMYDKVIAGTDGDLGRPGAEAVFSSASYQGGSSRGTALCLRSDGEAGSHVFRCVRPDKG